MCSDRKRRQRCGLSRFTRIPSTDGSRRILLQTDQEELILLKVNGAVALLLVESDPKWKKHLRKENGKWVIYVICKKAIYGTQ
jgi:hypothetical protein